jgi:hypothetical protein
MGVRKTKKATVRTNPDGSRTYGPYKGSKQIDGRPIMVTAKGKGQPGSTSTSAARDKKEASIGRKLSKSEHVAHKGARTNKQGNKGTGPSATRIESAKKNIGDENKRRGRARK